MNASAPSNIKQAEILGCTVEQIRRQHARNGAQLAEMADQAAREKRKVNNYTEAELRALAARSTEKGLTIANKISGVTLRVPAGKAREQALKEIRWAFETADGRFVRSDDASPIRLVDDPELATKFDGRDNEAFKRRFFTAILRTELTAILL